MDVCFIFSIASIAIAIAVAFFIAIRREKIKYKKLLLEGKYKYERLLKDYEVKLRDRMEADKQRQLKEAASVTHHLSNVISGMNHEISPWIGGIKNKISRIASKSKSSTLSLQEIAVKLNDVIKACDSMSLILDNLSKDVRKVQKYDTFTSNIHETIISWVRLTITDRSIKENLSEDNFIIDSNTLNFNCNHSPLLVSQVILNLVKNSIDHNQNMLDDLKIKISGDVDKKCLIYEDNGRGIPEEHLDSIFIPGVTTKERDREIHGLGLSLCRDYCSTMGAILLAESYDKGAKFVIFFEYDSTKSFENTKIRKAKLSRDSSASTASLQMLCKNYMGNNRRFDG